MPPSDTLSCHPRPSSSRESIRSASTTAPSLRFQRSGDRFRNALGVLDNQELSIDINDSPSDVLAEQNGKNSNQCTTKSSTVEPPIAIDPELLTIQTDEHIFDTLLKEKSLSRSNNPKCVRFFHFSSGGLRYPQRSTRTEVKQDRNNEDYFLKLVPLKKYSDLFLNRPNNLQDHDIKSETANNSSNSSI